MSQAKQEAVSPSQSQKSTHAQILTQTLYVVHSIVAITTDKI